MVREGGGGAKGCPDGLGHFLSTSKWVLHKLISCIRGVRTLSRMICALFCPYVMASVRKEKVGLKKVLHCACLTDGGRGEGGVGQKLFG